MAAQRPGLTQALGLNSKNVATGNLLSRLLLAPKRRRPLVLLAHELRHDLEHLLDSRCLPWLQLSVAQHGLLALQRVLAP